MNRPSSPGNHPPLFPGWLSGERARQGNSGMAGYIVFVRFFFNYPESTPFDKVAHLPDAEIRPELERLHNAWIIDPANAAEVAKQQPTRKQLAEARKFKERWYRSFMWGATPAEIRKAIRDSEAQAEAEAAKHSDHNITRRYPVACFESAEQADTARDSLQQRVKEIARAGYDRQWSQDGPEYIQACANPTFFAIPESELSPAERITVNEQLARLAKPPTKGAPLEEAILRVFMPDLTGTLEVLRHTVTGSAPPLKRPPETSLPDAESAVSAKQPKQRKRSTAKGEGKAKLIATLTQHHRYSDGGCLNTEPIGNNELAELADVSPSTASDFFKDEFDGHEQYRVVCRDAGRLVASLKLLNGEFSPQDLYGRRPRDEDDRDDNRED